MNRKVAWTARRVAVALMLAVAAALSGCTQGQHRAGREEYNAGLAALAAGNLPEAEKRLLAARDQSIGDPDLMFRANYNLGIAYVQDGDRRRADKDPDPAKALELYDQAIGWLRAAIKERTAQGGAELADAQANLSTALAKRSALSDELRKGDKQIEKRLDAVIALQRGILDQAQAAWAIVKTEGTQNPLAGQAELTALANSQRSAGAEAGVVVDMAADDLAQFGFVFARRSGPHGRGSAEISRTRIRDRLREIRSCAGCAETRA
jgi:tetratricopeptide (TPR) repeat protein